MMTTRGLRAAARRPARAALVVSLLGAALWSGCSTTRQVPIDTIAAEGAGKSVVVTHDHYTYHFAAVEVRGDSLVGTYYVNQERITGGVVAYVDVPRTTTLPLSRVERVEVRRLDYANTALLGAGAALFTIWATSLDDEKSADQQGRPSKGIPGIY